jgi:hypothetical protein
MKKENLTRPHCMDLFWTLNEVSDILKISESELKELLIKEGFVEKNENGNFIPSKEYKHHVKRKMVQTNGYWRFSHFEISSSLKEYFSLIC